jgi:hypothetical protein
MAVRVRLTIEIISVDIRFPDKQYVCSGTGCPAVDKGIFFQLHASNHCERWINSSVNEWMFAAPCVGSMNTSTRYIRLCSLQAY